MDNKEQLVREYLSEKAKSRWADPEFRARQMEARRKWWADPANRQKHREGQQRRWEKKND